VYLYRLQAGDFAQTKRLVPLMYGDASRLAESHISNVVGFVFWGLRPRHRDVNKHLFGDPGIDNAMLTQLAKTATARGWQQYSRFC
jgi:hypothetical protein